MIVADSSAFIALVNKETGWETLEPYADEIAMSAVNICESISSLRDKSIPDVKVSALIATLVTEIIAFDESQASMAADLRKITKPYGLSLGDRACIALGMKRKLPIFTADKIWAELKLDADIRLIR